ncbi:MAG: DUF3465 domain-containing protein [Clostridiales bacterium]|nr:MAG: DUF3465 domain-containing protein [Clostridiales bacterium]
MKRCSKRSARTAEKNAVRGMMFEYNNITVNFADNVDLQGIQKGDTISFFGKFRRRNIRP